MGYNDSAYAAGKNVLITGGSSGIGAELARNFAGQGANLALVARNHEKLKAVAKECIDLGAARVEVFSCDLTKDEEIQTTIAKATKSFDETLDIVVLNAGRSMGCYFEEIKDMESVNYMLKLNVNGVINTLMCALPAIPKSESSRIVIISSVSGVMSVPYRTIYCASKHALTGFANSLRIELEDTYGLNKAPKVQLINFPEVKGTDLNAGRMIMGATRPPAQFKTTTPDNNVQTVETACKNLMAKIEVGSNDWGSALIHNFVVLLRLFFASLADSLILKTVKKTHFRPDEQHDAKKFQ